MTSKRTRKAEQDLLLRLARLRGAVDARLDGNMQDPDLAHYTKRILATLRKDWRRVSSRAIRQIEERL